MSTLNTTNLKNPGSGSNNIVLNTDGSTTIPTLSATTIQGTIKSGTAVASTSGTAIDFTGIPSWVKRVTVMFSGVSTNGTSNYLIQLGDSGGIENTGYAGYAKRLTSTGLSTSSQVTSGFVLTNSASAAALYIGQTVLTTLGSNVWVMTSTIWQSNNDDLNLGGSAKTLSDTLTQLRITTVNGTDTFDAGSLNLLLEG